MKSKAIAVATKVPLRNCFNTLYYLQFLMPLLYSILAFLTPLTHLPLKFTSPFTFTFTVNTLKYLKNTFTRTF